MNKPVEYRGGNKVRRIKAFVLALLVAAVMAACSRQDTNTTETTTQISQGISTGVTEDLRERYMVYEYTKQNLLSTVDVEAAIGEEFELALDDMLAKDAYAALDGDFDKKLSENIKPGDKVILTSITYIDADGKIVSTSKKGTTVSDLDVMYDESGKEEGIAYGISTNGKSTIGYVSYDGNERHLVQDVTIKSLTSTAPSGYTYSDSYEVYDLPNPNFDGYSDIGNPYIIK